MRNFFKLMDGVDVRLLMANVMRHPELWNMDDVRTTFENSPHTDVDDILLRFGVPDGDDLEARDTPAMAILGAKEMVLNVMTLVKGSRLGRVVITKTEPGKKILPHRDVLGKYTEYYTRYHIVLQGLPGSIFHCGDESVQMLTGQLWWFDAHEEHSVVNNSQDDRVHMLVDVRIDT